MNQMNKFKFSTFVTCKNAEDRKRKCNLLNFAFSGHLFLLFSFEVNSRTSHTSSADIFSEAFTFQSVNYSILKFNIIRKTM